ncbi:MAG: hypothetical protein GX442_19175 [Candidatus Riflebacteria bacterium]|nr:hypothetical protein [Candidatus Riflebacteria bacterium]
MTPHAFPLVGSLVIVAGLSRLASSRGRWETGPLATAILLGTAAAAMVAALFLEGLIATVAPWPPWVGLALVTPLVEELLRFLVLQMAGVTTLGPATLAGGMMGLTETAFVLLRGPAGVETLAFRALASVPLHSFCGGGLGTGRGFLPIAMGTHLVFNLGFAIGGLPGYAVSLGGLGILAGFWLALVLAHPAPGETEAPSPPLRKGPSPERT